MEGRKFGEAPVIIDLKLQVEDSPNSAGCTIDAIRILKLALDRNIAGPIYSASAYFMKHPPKQFTDDEAKEMVEEFIKGERERYNFKKVQVPAPFLLSHKKRSGNSIL